MVFPAERTRNASMRSCSLSTSGIGSATVRHAGMPTVRYTARENMYAAVAQFHTKSVTGIAVQTRRKGGPRGWQNTRSSTLDTELCQRYGRGTQNGRIKESRGGAHST